VKIQFHKRYVVIFWLLVSVSILSWYFFGPGIDWVESLQDTVDENLVLSASIYMLVLSLRGLTFMPSTPLLFAGIVLFNPILVYLLNLIGIVTSSTLVYYFAQYLWIDDYFEKKYPKQLSSIQAKLKNKEFPVIAAWSLVFFVPTDLVVYAASTIRVHIWKVWAWVLVGEALLNAIYIYTGDEIGSLITNNIF